MLSAAVRGQLFLAAVFLIAAKISGHIAWSWWLVLAPAVVMASPLIISVGFGLVVIALASLALIFALFYTVYDYFASKPTVRAL